jgi:hypothetical protein
LGELAIELRRLKAPYSWRLTSDRHADYGFQLPNYKITQLPNRHHSYLSATSGSTLVARRAGM